MSIYQYCYGINCVLSNRGVIIDDEYLITISNDTLPIGQLLNDFIENVKNRNILSKEEIDEEIQITKLIDIIDKITNNAVIHLIYEHKDELEKDFEEQNFFKIEFDKILQKSNDIYGKYKSMMNERIIDIFYNELLKLTLCYYIIRLLLIKDKKKIKREDIIDKIKKDKEIVVNVYKEIIGEDLTNTTSKILDDIIGLLEIDKSMFSSIILSIRQYIGPAFTYGVAKKLIKLRSDLTNEEIIDCKKQCEEILNKYEGDKTEYSSHFYILDSKIKKNKKDKEYLKMRASTIKYGKEIEQNEDKSENESDEENKINEENSDKEEEVKNIQSNIDDDGKDIKNNLENFLKDNIDEIEEGEEEEEEKEIKKDEEEDVKPDLDGIFYKKTNAIYKKYYFQIKNFGLYWFEDQKSTKAKNKLSLKNMIVLNNEKSPKKFKLKFSNETDKEYKFKCNSEEEKNIMIKTITKSINDSYNIKDKIEMPIIEIKERKTMIKDYLKLNNKIKGTYIEEKILEYLKSGKYFKSSKKKIEKVLKDNIIQKQKEKEIIVENVKENEEEKEKINENKKDADIKQKRGIKNKIRNWFK